MLDTIPTSFFSNNLSKSIESIKDTLNVIATNTTPVEVMTYDIDEVNLGISILALIIGLLGTWFGWLAYKFSKKTADNVVRMSANTQLAQFNDLIRHLYRNLVVSIAFSKHQFETEDHCCYPSEVHLQKMKMLPEDVVHLEKYNDDTEVYKIMHELKLLMRNYNTEIDIAQMHLKEKNLENNILKDDLNGLCFKPFYLVKFILEIENCMDKRKSRKTHSDQYRDMIMIILSEHFNKLEENLHNINKWCVNYKYLDYCNANVSDSGRAFSLLKKLEKHISVCDTRNREDVLHKSDFLDEKNPYLRENARYMLKYEMQGNLEPLWQLTESEGLKDMILSDEWDFNVMLPILISVDVAIEYNKIKIIYF